MFDNIGVFNNKKNEIHVSVAGKAERSTKLQIGDELFFRSLMGSEGTFLLQ
jgi:hypothetical protein